MIIRELQALTDGQKTDLIGLMKELAPDIEVNAEVLERVVESPGSHLFAALDNEGHIIGCASLCVFESPTGRKASVEDEMLADVRRLMADGKCLPQEQIDGMSDQELAVWYNDHVIYPDKVRLNCYYYQHYSFIKDIQMILCTVLGRKMEYAGELI